MAASLETMTARQVAEEDLAVLDRIGCQYWACEGPDKPPVDMATCHVCWRIRELRALLGVT